MSTLEVIDAVQRALEKEGILQVIFLSIYLCTFKNIPFGDALVAESGL